MIYFENNQENFEVSDELTDLLRNSAENALKELCFNYDFEVNIYFTSNNELRDINREQRGIDKETDVLSFPMLEFNGVPYDSKTFIPQEEDYNPESRRIMLGDMIISLEKVKSQSIEYGHSFEREAVYLLVHSLLHLLGYDHIDEEDKAVMRKKEEEIMNILKIYR